MKLTEKRNEIGFMRRVAVVAACAVFGIGICGSALALKIDVNAPAAVNDTKTANPKSIHVSAEEMAKNKVSGPSPKYPEEAKEQRIQGTVVLDAVIGKDGTVEMLKAESGPKELQPSALDAVHEWIYKPFLLNGVPIEVETTINVVYTLAE